MIIPSLNSQCGSHINHWSEFRTCGEGHLPQICCKNIFMVCTNHNNMKYISRQMITAVSTFLYTQFHSTGISRRRPLLQYPQVIHGKRETTFHSVSNNRLPQYMPYSILEFSFTHEQFANSCVVATNAVNCSYSTFSWHAQSHSRSPNPEMQNQFNTIKIFSWVSQTMKIFLP